VAVSVYDAPELTRTVRVDPDGTIRLPLLPEGVKAAGLMPRDLEEELAAALKSAEILVDPVVKITVVEYHSRPISVMGAVRKPVTFQSDGAVTLLDALSRAEGLTDEAGPEILVTQNDVVRHIAVKQLIDGADPAANLRLTGNEEIRVPVAGKIFVLGNIRKPGAFPVRDPADTTVLKMVALSEGLMPFSEKIAYIVRRREGETPQEIPIELARIMQRKSPDVALAIGDILYIPDNKTRRSTMSILDRVAGFGASTASGVLIWH
jgi:polysaccharide export outer membrane protein